jgi:hypothetical protein
VATQSTSSTLTGLVLLAKASFHPPQRCGLSPPFQHVSHGIEENTLQLRVNDWLSLALPCRPARSHRTPSRCERSSVTSRPAALKLCKRSAVTIGLQAAPVRTRNRAGWQTIDRGPPAGAQGAGRKPQRGGFKHGQAVLTEC